MQKIALLLILVVFLSGCSSELASIMTETEVSPLAIEAAGNGGQVFLEADDYMQISGMLYDVKAERSVLLVHQLGGDETDWQPIVSHLLDAGYNVLAIDLRGHGHSEGDWKDFGKLDFLNMPLDVKAGKKFLDDKYSGEVVFVGASIGANAVLNYAAADESVHKIILISPGMNYRGLSTREAVLKYNGFMLLSVGEDDTASRKSATELFTLSPIVEGNKEYRQYKTDAHGTDIFFEQPLIDDILYWLEARQ